MYKVINLLTVCDLVNMKLYMLSTTFIYSRQIEKFIIEKKSTTISYHHNYLISVERDCLENGWPANMIFLDIC